MGNLSLWKVLLLIFIPTSLLMLVYIPAGLLLQDTLPSLLLFVLLATIILFPIQLFVVLSASKKEYGTYSLKSAFSNHQKMSWWKILIYGALLWGFAGLMTITIAPLEDMLFAPVAERVSQIIPPYFDWTDIDYLRQYSTNILLLACVMIFILNGFIGPIVEELFFRGYLTAKISRFGIFAPLIITFLFSLYHFWLPFNNLFRIFAFFPAFYLAWKKKNIYIAIVTHVLSNIFSSISYVLAISAIL
jgi:uncharacterized protein